MVVVVVVGVFSEALSEASNELLKGVRVALRV